eukprot:Amastigsp_a844952_21.p1 type:complete len:306 gc:universal Amastigsp_a844952_21:961-44(-)
MIAAPAHGLIDIGANLLDGMFQGEYHGRKKHAADLDAVLDRAFESGVVSRVIITGGSLEESRSAAALASTHPRLFSTVGVHPTRAGEFESSPLGSPEGHLAALLEIVRGNASKVAAVGEFGLDYDRLHFCSKDTQRRYFEMQFELARAAQLPLFLHDRNTGGDFFDIIRAHRGDFHGGVVHSFTGTVDEVRALLDLGLYIGVNGCSMKTEANLEAVRAIPSERLLLETDAPWCELKPTHASWPHVRTHFPTKKVFTPGFCVKARSEPVHIVQVLEAVAGVRGQDEAELAALVNANTLALFPKLAT